MRVQNPVQFAAATAVRMAVNWSVTWFVLSVVYKIGGATAPLGVVTLVALGAVIWQVTKVKTDGLRGFRSNGTVNGSFQNHALSDDATQHFDELRTSLTYKSLVCNIHNPIHHGGSPFDPF